MHVCGGYVACAVFIVVGVCIEVAKCGPWARSAGSAATDSATADSAATDGASQTAADKWETQKTYHVLTDVLDACGEFRSNATHPYCSELVTDDNNEYYSPLSRVITETIQKIQTILTALSVVERTAIVCRGLKRLLPIVMYGIFTDDVIRGIEITGAAVFDELFATEPEPEPAESARNGSDRRIRAGYVEKIKLLVRAVRPFAVGRPLLDGGADEAIEVATPAGLSPASYRRLLLSVFRAADDSYRARCFPGYVDADALLTADLARRTRSRAHAIRMLGREADRAYERARGDINVLLLKWHGMYGGQRQTDDPLPVAYFRTFNKYADPAVWSLIGDQIIVVVPPPQDSDESTSTTTTTTTTTTLNVIASRDKRRIDEMADALVETVRTAVRCRGLMYANLMTKLYANATRALLWRPRPEPRTDDDEFREYYGRIEVDGLLHGFDGRLADQIPADDDDDEVFAIYSEYNVRHIGTTVDDIGESFNVMGNVTVDAELTAMIVDLEDALRRPATVKRRTVEALIKWRARGERMYRDWCLHADDGDGRLKQRMAALDDTVRKVLRPDDETAPVTLKWITDALDRVIKLVNKEIDYDYIFEV